MRKQCECGCGLPAPIATRTRRERGQVRGQPVRFIRGHTHFNGYRKRHRDGYSMVNVGGRYVLEHVVVAERALGKPLPPSAQVHHVNEDRGDNRPENLVVCESDAYHKLLHQRRRALDACGNAGWRKCPYCKTYGNPADMIKHGNMYEHGDCVRAYQRARYEARRVAA